MPEERAAYLTEACGDDASLRKSVEELLEAHREQPNDADAAAELAYGYLQRSANTEAGELVVQRR